MTDTTETITMGVVAVMALKMAADVFKARQVKNGHSAPSPAAVRPKDALWFAQTQAKILRLCNRLAREQGLEEELESEFEED